MTHSENLDAWADLYIFIPTISFLEEQPCYLQVYYKKGELNDMKTVLLRRILRDIGHKIIKWEVNIENNESRDLFTIDIPKEEFIAKADHEGNKFFGMMEEFESATCTHHACRRELAQQTTEESDSDDSDSEEEPSPQIL